MTELGWAAVRVRDLTRGGYRPRTRVRGYMPADARESSGDPLLLTGHREQVGAAAVMLSDAPRLLGRAPPSSHEIAPLSVETTEALRQCPSSQ